MSDPSASGEAFVVAVRVRPPNARELASEAHKEIVKIVDRNILCFDPRPDADDVFNHSARKRPRQIAQRREKDLRMAFDCVFPGTATQDEVYSNTAKRLVHSVMEGYNASCFAYGATGAGKTCTMIGNDHVGPGVMVLTMRDIFDAMQTRSDDTKFDVVCSYLEIYNETIRDLLLPEGRGKPLDLREDTGRGMVIAGLSTHTPKAADEVFDLLARGNRNRSQCATDANSESSRSHGVFQIIVTHRDRSGGDSAVRVSKLSMIDLAGSERASVSKNQGAVMREGANINRSLLALGNCINALSSGEAVGFVPYRDSKLTRLLKDSLGGNTRTVMIAAVSPSSLSHEDTHNTLQYANRAKNIKVKAVKNEHSVEFHISQYSQMLADQRAQILELQSRLSLALASRATVNRVQTEENQVVLNAAERAVNKRLMAFGEMQDRISAQYEDELKVRKRLRRAQLVAALQEQKMSLQLTLGVNPTAGLPSIKTLENEAQDARTVAAQRAQQLIKWQHDLRTWLHDNSDRAAVANNEEGHPSALGPESRALLEVKSDALVAKTTASALEARLNMRQQEISYLNDQLVMARVDAAAQLHLHRQIAAELAERGIELSEPLAAKLQQRCDQALQFADSPFKAYPFLRDEFSATPSPSMANRRMRHSNLTPIMQSPSGASPHSRMPLAPAAARLFASPPPTQTAATTAPMEREYFTDMSTADYFNVPSAMGVAGPAAKQGGSMMQQAIVNNARAALTSASGAPRPRVGSARPQSAHASVAPAKSTAAAMAADVPLRAAWGSNQASVSNSVSANPVKRVVKPAVPLPSARPMSARPLTSGGSGAISNAQAASSYSSQHQRLNSAAYHKQQAQFAELQQMWGNENSGDVHNEEVPKPAALKSNPIKKSVATVHQLALPDLPLQSARGMAAVSARGKPPTVGAHSARAAVAMR